MSKSTNAQTRGQAPRIATVHTLGEFTAEIEKAMADPGASNWYRGCGRSEYTLTPSLYRHPSQNNPADLIFLEEQIIARFKQRSVPYLTRSIATDWEYLFFMQHFGVPTRLLDWTENPYIALYFAIAAAPRTNDQNDPEYSDDAAVWILNPSVWNRTALSHIRYGGGVLSFADQQLSGYAPGSPIQIMNNEAVAVYGTHNSPRIVAQRGVFTMFGQNTCRRWRGFSKIMHFLITP